MPGTRLHRLTTIYLAAVYGVVGLTGESLHYLTTDVTGFWSNSPSDEVETVVYYHVHGPDYQGHFHRYTYHRHLSGATTDVHDKARQGIYDAAIALEGTTHQPHTCPILTLVSTLKLGHAGCCTNSIILDSLVTPTWESGVISAFEVARYSFARGPPRASFA